MKNKTLYASLLRRALLLGAWIVAYHTAALAQTMYTISGYVEDAATGEKLIGANVYSPTAEAGVSTNTYGFFSLTIPRDSVVLTVSYVGYQSRSYNLFLNRDVVMTFKLVEGEALETVEIVAENQRRIEEEVQMSQVQIPIQTIKDLPAFLGEVDVLKTLQLLPGVQSGTEGLSGLYVRGGSPDQNLILLDGVPLYNVSHLFGFFSVFNADAIKNVTLTKGGYPARYGGRLSSVLDINMKEGNMNEFRGDATVSNIASKVMIEGPIVKDKASFMVAARRTYLDVVAAPFIAMANASSPSFRVDPAYYFYDVNAKLNWKISDKDRVYLSVYNGLDDFKLAAEEEYDQYFSRIETGLDWGNTIWAARWNHVWGSKLFSNVTLTSSDYNFRTVASYRERFEDQRSSLAGIYNSGIQDYSAKVDFDYIISPKHYVRAGGNWTHHTFTPGATNIEFSFAQEPPFDTTLGTADIYAQELYAYVEDEINLGKFRANVGLHASAFKVGNEWYSSLQPRIGVNYQLPRGVALKASYAQMQQYINLLTNEGIGLPTDLWVPSTENIKPQTSWQVALGIAKTYKDFEFSLEGYYKEMDNLLSYREGANFLFSLENDWEQKVTQGIGNSYGIEAFVQKKRGNTSGWVGYTLAWSNRQFAEINDGQWFPFTYDRRHDLSVALTHKVDERVSISAVYIYGTGRAITLPLYKYYAVNPAYNSLFNNFVVEEAPEKNNFRMSAYHRLDLSVQLYKKKKYFDRWWIFSVYNAYNHLNPFFMTSSFDQNGDISFREFGLFPLIPSAAYRIKF